MSLKKNLVSCCSRLCSSVIFQSWTSRLRIPDWQLRISLRISMVEIRSVTNVKNTHHTHALNCCSPNSVRGYVCLLRNNTRLLHFFAFVCISYLCPFLATMSFAGFLVRSLLSVFPVRFGLVPVYLIVTTTGFVGDQIICDKQQKRSRSVQVVKQQQLHTTRYFLYLLYGKYSLVSNNSPPFGVCVCVFSSHSYWTSMDVPAGAISENS